MRPDPSVISTFTLDISLPPSKLDAIEQNLLAQLALVRFMRSLDRLRTSLVGSYAIRQLSMLGMVP